jgi:hypothetical protein
VTVYVTEILGLTGDEKWEQWGDDWWDHVERLGEAPSGSHYGLSLIRLLDERGYQSRQLDWGAFLYEVTKPILIELYGEEAELPPHGQQPAGSPTHPLRDLDEEASYGIVVIEH